MASRIAGQGSQLLVFFVAARFLSPAEFGVFSLLSAVNMLMTRLGQAGWVEFAASWRGAAEVDDHGFTLATAGGLAVAVLGSIAAGVFLLLPSLAQYANVQLLLSLSVLGTGSSAFWAGLLLRRQHGEALAKSIAVSQIVGGGAAIFMLVFGWKMTGLATGKLVTHVVNLAMVAASVRWFPRPRWTSSGLGPIKQYNRSILSSNLIGYSRGYAATLALGLFLGTSAVGLYRAGARVVGALAEIIGEPAKTVCWMSLREAVDRAEPSAAIHGTREQRAQHALTRSSERFLALIVLLTTPVFLGLAATSDSAVRVLLGEAWLGAAPIVTILAVARLISLPSVLTAPLLSMAKRVDKLPRVDLISGAATILALPVSAPFGVLWAALGQLAAAIFGSVVAARAHARYADVRFRRALALGAPSALASLVMVIVLYSSRDWAREVFADIRVRLVAELALGGGVFLGLFTILGGWRRLVATYTVRSS